MVNFTPSQKEQKKERERERKEIVREVSRSTLRKGRGGGKKDKSELFSPPPLSFSFLFSHFQTKWDGRTHLYTVSQEGKEMTHGISQNYDLIQCNLDITSI